MKNGEAEELLLWYFFLSMDTYTRWFRGKFNIVGGDSIGCCEERKFVWTCD